MTAFISYQRKSSAALANLVCKGLSEHGIISFLDTINLNMCGPFPDYLRQEIKKANVFVCLLGSSTLNSEWVLEEIKCAHEKKGTSIPVFQEDFVMTEELYPECVIKLLQNNGIKVLDKSGIYIPEAINHLAVMIKFGTQGRDIDDHEMHEYRHNQEKPPRYGYCRQCETKFFPNRAGISARCPECFASVHVQGYKIEVSGTNAPDVQAVILSILQSLKDEQKA